MHPLSRRGRERHNFFLQFDFIAVGGRVVECSAILLVPVLLRVVGFVLRHGVRNGDVLGLIIDCFCEIYLLLRMRSCFDFAVCG